MQWWIMLLVFNLSAHSCWGWGGWKILEQGKSCMGSVYLKDSSLNNWWLQLSSRASTLSRWGNALWGSKRSSSTPPDVEIFSPDDTGSPTWLFFTEGNCPLSLLGKKVTEKCLVGAFYLKWYFIHTPSIYSSVLWFFASSVRLRAPEDTGCALCLVISQMNL